MATGERTQMSAINVLVVSPLWNGELSPQDEWSDLPSHERARTVSPGSAGSRRQDKRCSRRVTSASGSRDCSC